MNNNFLSKLKDEPIALIGLIAAIIIILRVFHIVEISSDQKDAIDGLIMALFVFCRWLVYSPSTVDDLLDTQQVMVRDQTLEDVRSLAPKKTTSKRTSTMKKAAPK
jgi:hypothetical protein